MVVGGLGSGPELLNGVFKVHGLLQRRALILDCGRKMGVGGVFRTLFVNLARSEQDCCLTRHNKRRKGLKVVGYRPQLVNLRLQLPLVLFG